MKCSMRLSTLSMLSVLLLTCCSKPPEYKAVNPLIDGSSQALTKLADHYLVEYSCSVTSLVYKVNSIGGRVSDVFNPINIAVVEHITEEQAAALQLSQGVISVTRDLEISWVPDPGTPQPEHVPVGIAKSVSSHHASATFVAIRWGLTMPQALRAWSTMRGDRDVRIGILDTGGSPDHIDLRVKYDETRSRNFSSSNPDNSTDWQDRHFHATRISSMVASNNFRTADAVSFSTLVAVKVLSDDGTAAFANILAGIIYAADPGSGNVDIINMSLGGLGPKADYSHLLGMINRAIDWANSNGVLVVCSGGNDAFELDHNGNVTTIPAMSGNRIAAVQTW